MTLHFRDEGEGAPTVLLHGLGTSSRIFDSLYERRGARRLITVDLPRSGRSGHWASSTPDHIGSALLRFLDSRQVSRFALFGHSFGGLVALHLASAAPNRILKLTVASAPALGLPAEFKLLLQSPLADLAMGWLGRMPVWRPALKQYMRITWGDVTKADDLQLSIYEEALRAPGFGEGMLEALRAISSFRLPAMPLADAGFEKHVLWGEKDRLLSVIQGEQLARSIKGQLRVLTGVGHCVPEEHPQALFDLLIAP